MNKKQSPQSKKYIRKVNEILKTKERVVAGQKIIGEVNALNKIISDTIYIKDNVAVDLKNFSLISIAEKKDIS